MPRFATLSGRLSGQTKLFSCNHLAATTIPDRVARQRLVLALVPQANPAVVGDFYRFG